MTDDASDPSDHDIEQILQRATVQQWDSLWAAVDAVEREAEHLTWGGGQQVDTTLVDGVERPVFQMPYAVYSEATERLLQALYGIGAIVPFNWPDWHGVKTYRGGGDPVRQLGSPDGAEPLDRPDVWMVGNRLGRVVPVVANDASGENNVASSGVEGHHVVAELYLRGELLELTGEVRANSRSLPIPLGMAAGRRFLDPVDVKGVDGPSDPEVDRDKVRVQEGGRPWVLRRDVPSGHQSAATDDLRKRTCTPSVTAYA